MARRGGCLGRLIRKLLTTCVLLGILIYPFAEPFWLRVDERTLIYPSLPQNFDGLRIAYISDIHLGLYYSNDRLDSLIAQISAEHPDLILLGGDYANDSDTAVEFFQSGPAFSAPLGVYAVPGNHDRVMPESNFPLLLQAMREAGVTPLCNAIAPIQIDGQFIYLAGIDDYAVGHPDIQGVAAATRASDFTIFLTHNPDAIPKAQKARDSNGQTRWADLILSGHTHGGQVTVFGQRALFEDMNHETGERFRSGWKHEENADILISNGVGTSFLPVRFFARPELHLITLRRI